MNTQQIMKCISSANKALFRTKKTLQAAILNGDIKPFNNGLRGHGALVCYDALSTHRLVNKFAIQDDREATTRKQRCFDEWIAFEDKLATFSFNDSINALSREDKVVLYRAKYVLHFQLLKRRFKPERFRPMLTTGAGFFSAGGDDSIIAKLSSLKHQVCTFAAVDLAINLINFSRGILLECIVRHYLCAHKEYLPPHLSFNEWVKLECFHADEGYIRGAFLHVVHLVNGARGETVPKNVEDDRFINCEPLWNMILQRAVSDGFFLKHLKAIGNDIPTGQQRHQVMIATPGVSTVDFRKASDSIHYDCASFFIPARIFSHLVSIRSYTTYIKSMDLEVVNHKISPMGNGFTFEVMTTILLAIARSIDPKASVFGDDVIICDTGVDQFVRIANAIGFTVNETKTFINSNFRESCGGFYHDDFGAFTTFEFHQICNMRDLYTTCNKLRRMLDKAPSGARTDWMERLHRQLMMLVPAFAKGPDCGALMGCKPKKGGFHFVETQKSLDFGYAISANWKKHQSSSPELRDLFKEKLLRHSAYLRDTYCCELVGIISVPTWVPKGHFARQDNVSFAERGAYLYEGRRPRRTITGKGKFKDITYLVLDSGLLLNEDVIPTKSK